MRALLVWLLVAALLVDWVAASMTALEAHRLGQHNCGEQCGRIGKNPIDRRLCRIACIKQRQLVELQLKLKKPKLAIPKKRKVH
jgi:hypothetical protein